MEATVSEIHAYPRRPPNFAEPLFWGEENKRESAMRGHPLQDTRKHRLLLELASRLNGRLREAGTHLGGMVLGNHQYHLSERVPLEPSGKEGLLRTQYDKEDLEYIGVPKFDLLGLRMHTALSNAGELASERVGEKIDPYDLPPDDKETYALIRSGNNAGMFQLESPGQLHLSRRLKPRRYGDLVAQISLFRPGPVKGNLVIPYVRRRNGDESYSVPLPHLLDEVLRPTYGVMVYQEQVQEVCHRVAGFSLAEADEVRRAMTSLRGPGALGGLRKEFVRRAVKRGVAARDAAEIFSWIEGFASYGFSAAHAASFAEISYASAYMKCHYPAEFFCGLLNAQPMGFYSPRVLLNEARREGIEVLPPDIHLSGEGFTVEESEAGSALRVGLKYTKHLTRRALGSILEARQQAPFCSVADLYARTSVESDGLVNLIKGGFLDGLNAGRSKMLAQIRRLPRKRRRKAGAQELLHPSAAWCERQSASLSASLLSGSLEEAYLPPTAEQEERMEWEALGLNVGRHPLCAYRKTLRDLGVTPSREAWNLPMARGPG